jgi:hypothetical protein
VEQVENRAFLALAERGSRLIDARNARGSGTTEWDSVQVSRNSPKLTRNSLLTHLKTLPLQRGLGKLTKLGKFYFWSPQDATDRTGG